MIHTVKGFGAVNKAEVKNRNSLAFSSSLYMLCNIFFIKCVFANIFFHSVSCLLIPLKLPNTEQKYNFIEVQLFSYSCHEKCCWCCNLIVIANLRSASFRPMLSSRRFIVFCLNFRLITHFKHLGYFLCMWMSDCSFHHHLLKSIFSPLLFLPCQRSGDDMYIYISGFSALFCCSIFIFFY